ncbi:MAG TPA: hypothetical protein VNH84_09400, partial [Candidatus Saccharimonadales bacterium]|nr:hypothetical protein [Candidatus Saccharimonadales bacterium]
MDNQGLKPVSKTTKPRKGSSSPNVVPTPGGGRTQLKTGNGPVQTDDGFVGLLERYGCGPIQFAGSSNASYER